jgi:queuosine precursor transporter
MNRRIGLVSLGLYVATIWLANWAVNHYGIVSVGFGLVAPAGVYFAGLALTLRDVTQKTLGKAAVVAAILLGAGLSYLIGGGATIPGGHASIAVASGIAFLFSEFCDFAVYTPLAERRWLAAVLASNTVGALVDSLLFLWLAFGSVAFWKGQFVGKMTMTLVAVAALAFMRSVWADRADAGGVA